jgi:hydroxyethylthiazole kinase-like uncharacterized protein yjeF
MPAATANLPSALYRASQVRELDRIAIEDLGIPGYTLMGRAGEAAYRLIRARWPEARDLTVVCGLGNNAGDGYVVARLAARDALQVRVVQIGDAGRLRGDALTARRDAEAAGVASAPFQGEGRFNAGVIVDAVFGTGLDREVTGEWRDAILAINASACPVLAVDIPSGIAADTGGVLGAAVRARATVTYIGLKQGLFTGDGPEHCGDVLFHDLQVPPRVYETVPAAALRLEAEGFAGTLAPRHRAAHKGRYGHVLVVGGDEGYGGAARMAGEAAARCGAGLVSVAMRPASLPACGPRPELMCRGVTNPAELEPLLERCTVVAVGPGLGRADWGRAMLDAVLDTSRPLVVDADALNLLAQRQSRREDWVLTPHPGEAGRLLGVTAAEVQSDRFAAAASLQERFGGVVVLKGAGTLVAGADGPAGVCERGNPGMASGGMGDVLTGIIAGLLAQGLPLRVAASLGVCLHARASDRAVTAGERGLLATDLLGHLRRLVNPEQRP